MHAMVWPYMNIIMSRDSYVYFKDLTVEMGCLIGFLSSLPILDFIGALIAMCAFKRFEKAATLSQKAFCLDWYYVNCLCRDTDYSHIHQLSESDTNEDEREVRTREPETECM